jgi:hypothetical protein
MDSQDTQAILIGIDFLLIEVKSVTGGLFVSKRAKKSGVDGGDIHEMKILFQQRGL